MTKWIEDLKIGDKVIIGSELYTITKQTKTQFTVLKDGTGGGSKYNFERINMRGSVIGDRHAFARALEVTPEEFLAAKQAKLDAKKAEADARMQAWNEKVALVKGRNGNIIVTDEGMGGLKKAVMVDSKDEPMIVYFDVKPEQEYDYRTGGTIEKVRISCSTWRKDWGERYGFSQTQATGATIEDALVDLVAGHYWD